MGESREWKPEGAIILHNTFQYIKTTNSFKTKKETAKIKENE
jgi:hypothetical protein